MQSFAESLANGGAFGYLALLFGLGAIPLGITGLIVALVSRRKKPGFVLGITTAGLCALSFLVALLGYVIGMSEANAAVASAAPDMASSIGTMAVAYAVGPMKISLMLIGLPFVLAALTISRAAVRPSPEEAQEYLSNSKKRTDMTGRAGSILGAILPGVFTLVGFLAFALQNGGLQYLAMGLSDAGGFGLLTIFWSIAAAVLLSILGPKAARGYRVLIAPLLLLACLPWIVGALATLSVGAESLSALESAAPDQRAAVMAMGISASLTAHTLGALISTWLLFALGLTLAVGAKGQRAASPLGGRGFLLGALSAVPVLILAGVAAVGETFSVLLVFSALFATVITMLGGSGIGTDAPHHRSVSLGVGAAAAGSLAFAATCHGAAGGFVVNAFSALEVAAPDQRVQAMGSAAEIMGRVLFARDYGWIIVLLTPVILGGLTFGRAPLGKGRLTGALFAATVFILAPCLYLMTGSMLQPPEWSAPKSPWGVDPGFAPSVVTPAGCNSGESGADPAAVVGVGQVYMSGQACGDPALPATAAQMTHQFSRLRQLAGRTFTGGEVTYDIAVDHRLPVTSLHNVLGAARAAGLQRVRLLGTEMPENPVPLQPTGDPADMHPLLGPFTRAMGNQVCGIEVDLESFVREAGFGKTWHGVVGMNDQIPVAPFGAGNPGVETPPNIRIPARSAIAIREMMYDAPRPYEPTKGRILLVADASMSNLTAGRLILATAAARTAGYLVSLPDPSSVASSAATEQGNQPAPTSSSKIRMGNLMVKGSISKDEIRRVIGANMGDIEQCRGAASKRKPGVLGQVSVKLIISGTGDVHSAALSSSTTGDAELDSCIVTAHRQWSFPGPRGGGIAIVTAAYAFMAAEAE